MKLCKKLIAAIVVIAMCAACVPFGTAFAGSRLEVPEGYDFYVYFDVEAFSMGWGFLVEPMAVPAREGENLATVTLRALDMAGKQYSYSGSPETGMYLRGIECPYTQANVPAYIMEQFDIYPAWAEENLGEPYGSWTGNYTDDGILSEMEYSSFAGWMFAVDGYAASVGCDGVTVVENTVYSWMFTVYGWGMDCGLNDGWGMFPDFDNPASITWRPRVLRGYADYASDPAFVAKMAEGGQAHAEYVAFMNAVTDLSSSQEAIDSAFAALEEALYDFYVYIDFEAFTLGWGFIVEPMKVPAYEGENLASVTLRALEMANNAPAYSGSVDSGFYLMGIECSYTEPNIPQYIMDQFDIYPAWAEENMGMSFGQWTGARTLEGMLYEWDFSDFGGWMFSVNDVAGAVGADGITVNEGDVCRWMFSVYGWGMDCGLNDGWGMFPEFDNPAEGVLRADVIKGYVELLSDPELAARFEEGGSSYEANIEFVDVLTNIASSQEEIDSAFAALIASTYDFDVYVDFEAFTMGWGFILEPMKVPAREGENVAAVTLRALEMAGLAARYSGSAEGGFYLQGVECPYTMPNVPAYIMEAMLAYPDWAEEEWGMSFGEWTGSYTDDGMLCEMEYSGFAGWMFAVNDVAGALGADGITVNEGDVCRWMFSVYGWGMDCGLNDGWGMFPEFDNPAEGVLRSDVIKGYAELAENETYAAMMAEGGQAHDEYEAFIAAVTNIASSQEEIDAAYAALVAALNGSPNALPGDADVNGFVNFTDVSIIYSFVIAVNELSAQGTINADYNMDGVVNFTDISLLYSFIVGA